MQYFCLRGILPFSKSYPEIESIWTTTKCWGKKKFDTLYYSYLYSALCKFFIFFQNIFWNQKHVTNQFKQARNYLCNVSWKFSIKIESTWRRKIKEQAPQLTLLYCSITVRSSHQRCCLRKLFLKNFAISTGNTCVGLCFLKSCTSLNLRLVFVFKLASLVLKKVSICIQKPKTNTLDKPIKFWH